jgi:hypothetical protein
MSSVQPPPCGERSRSAGITPHSCLGAHHNAMVENQPNGRNPKSPKNRQA